MKTFFKNEFQKSHFGLNHHFTSDFSVSIWQKGKSKLPLLVTRIICAITALALTIWTNLTPVPNVLILIYLTNWGMYILVVTSLLGVVVSAMAMWSDGGVNDSFSLPIYVKFYWLFYNITAPIAFSVTVIYWAFLFMPGMHETADGWARDISVHALNSVIMMVLMLTARHPSRLLHFYQPFCFCLIYLFFSLIFFFAGGVDPFGNPFIYPILDWRTPGPASITVIGTALLIIFLHGLAVLMAVGRDALARATVGRSRGPPARGHDNQAFDNPGA